MQTIGEKLAEARQRQGARIQDVAESTHVRSDYLEALENNQFSRIPLADIYKQGFIKIYARYLRLDTQSLLDDYARSQGITPAKRAVSGDGTGISNSVAATAPNPTSAATAATADSANAPGTYVPSGIVADDGSGANADKVFSFSNDTDLKKNDPGVVEQGARPASSSRQWLYVVVVVLGILLCLGLAFAVYFPSTKTPPPAKTTTPALPQYKVKIFATSDTAAAIWQIETIYGPKPLDGAPAPAPRRDRKKKIFDGIVNARGKDVMAQGQIEITSDNINNIYVHIGSSSYNNPANNSAATSFFVLTAPEILGTLPTPPAATPTTTQSPAATTPPRTAPTTAPRTAPPAPPRQPRR
jgi:hypothetical protein